MESAFADGPQQHLVIYHCIACDMLVLLAERWFSSVAVSDLGDGISRGHDADREGDPVEPHSESLSVLFHDASAVSLRGKGASRRSQFFETDPVFACGIIVAALSARQIAAYPNISQYIKVDSYLKITRLSGYYRDPNFYCAHITACLAGVQLLMSRERRRSRQIVWIGVMMVLVYCGLLSASKSFVVVLACLFLVWVPVLLTGGHVKRGIAILAGVACAAAVMLLSAAVQDLLRMVMSRFSYAANVSDLTTHRSEIWRMYLHDISHDPVLMLLGSGFTSVTLGTKASHNTIIQGAFQFGLIGLPVLCAWLVMTLKRTSGRSGCRKNAFLLMCVGVVLPWMALDILFFDEFFLLPVYAVIGAGYAAPGDEQIDGNVVRAVERMR